jgi:hypothetical protein
VGSRPHRRCRRTPAHHAHRRRGPHRRPAPHREYGDERVAAPRAGCPDGCWLAAPWHATGRASRTTPRKYRRHGMSFPPAYPSTLIATGRASGGSSGDLAPRGRLTATPTDRLVARVSPSRHAPGATTAICRLGPERAKKRRFRIGRPPAQARRSGRRARIVRARSAHRDPRTKRKCSSPDAGMGTPAAPGPSEEPWPASVPRLSSV